MVQTYIKSGMKSDFTTRYSPPISLDDSKLYEAALLSIDLFNSIPNITNLNNVLRYSKDDGNSWVNIELDTGSYELSAINNEIQRLIQSMEITIIRLIIRITSPSQQTYPN